MVRPEAIAATDLQEYLATCDDFQFEREAYSWARELNMQASHAGLYLDPIKHLPRQFDVRASMVIETRKVNLAIECKANSADNPLLISRVPRADEESFHEFLYTGGYTPIIGGPAVAHVKSRLFVAGAPVGKKMQQVTRKETKVIAIGDLFDKWSQAMASVGDMTKQAAEELRPSKQARHCIGFMPVLAVSDDALWSVDYSTDGRAFSAPAPATEVTFYMGRRFDLGQVGGQTIVVSHLHIVTRSRLKNLLREVASGGELWQSMFGEGP